MLWEPKPYMIEACKFMVSQATGGLLLDPGLGKTSITLQAFKILKAKNLINRMLVICPLRPAQITWPAEAKLWDQFSDLKLRVLHGDRKEEYLLDPAVDIHVVNPEGLPWLLRAMPKIEWPWDMLVVDESTKFKHTQTMRFKMLKPLLTKFRRRYILTGSPAPNGLLDLFGQIYILDLGNSLGQFITHYRLNYFYPAGFGGYDWKPMHDAPERIYKKIAPLVIRMAGNDYLQLPPLINSTIEIELPDVARAAYNSMENLLLAALKDNTIIASNAGAATNKCRQIANGGIYHDDGETFTQLHEEKADAVADLIEQLQGRPALVAYEYRHDLARLRARLGKEVPYIGGGISAGRFREIEERWNQGDLPILLAQPQSVAHGLNLQGTRGAIIWHSIPWDLEIYEQFIRRVWRQGQQDRVFNYHIVAKETVDESVMKALAGKDRTQQALLSALRDYSKRRIV